MLNFIEKTFRVLTKMRLLTKAFLFFFTFMSSVIPQKAMNLSTSDISIYKINTLKQLPVNAIHRIFQDSEGYIWYGTVDGLCRDDGYNVCVFRSDMYTPGIIEDNLILCIKEDNQRKIWFGTAKGAYILDKKNYLIKPLDRNRLKDKYIDRIERTKDGTMWVAIAGQLLHYQADGRFIKSYGLRYKGINQVIGGFCQGRDESIIFTFFKGDVFFLDKKTDKIIPFPKMKKENINGANIFQDRSHQYYWLTTWGNGIIRFNPKAKNIKQMYVTQPIPITTCGQKDGIILYAVQDKHNGWLWCTTQKDIMAYSIDKKGMIRQINIDGLIPRTNKMLNDIICDRYGNLWISAFDRPSFILKFSSTKPSIYTLPALQKSVSYPPAIMAITDAGNGLMWVSQERVGLFLYNINTNVVSKYTDFSSTHNITDEIRIMCQSSKGNGIWIAPDKVKDVYQLTRNGMKMQLNRTITMPSYLIPGSIKSLLETRSSRFLWIGGLSGLYVYDINKCSLRTISRQCGPITDLAEDGNGNIWFCSGDGGLYRYSTDGRIKHYYDEKGLTRLSITNEGDIWASTVYGELLMYDPHSQSITNYTKSCGLNGNQVNQIVTDLYNHIWINTNNKIIEFNPHNGSYKTYLTSDDISRQLWRLIPTTLCVANDDRIFFGGIPGIMSVTPSARLERDAKSVNVTITNVNVMNSSIFFGKNKYKQSPSEITIDENDRNIEIEFSTLDQCHATETRYAYRLKDVDKDWIHTRDGENSAIYNHLQKGTYIFQVKATDENGLWSNKITEMTIKRLPAFYESWLAYLVYFLITIFAITYSILRYRHRIEEKNNELWADSKEMMRMRDYLDNRQAESESETIRLDKIIIDKAIKAVEMNITDSDFGVNKLSETMNMSRSTFTRKLKNITGETPLEFIRKIKMNKACQMLCDKDKSITEIAFYLGYYDRKYFTSCFKEEFGMTPTEYQKTHQQKG
jgi:ligand-binding sensor domain-containing protein/AraC-like DNA-binding protein